MSMCSELTSGRNNEEVARLPILRHSTCSASRNTLLKVEFQQFFGSKGSGARYYNKSLKLKKKTSIEVVHASRVLEYEALDRWLRKHNLTNSSKGHLALTDREFMIFFKWFEMKMKRHWWAALPLSYNTSVSAAFRPHLFYYSIYRMCIIVTKTVSILSAL